MKAINVSLRVLAVVLGMLIPIVLPPSWLPCKDVVIPLKEMPRASPVPD